MFKRILYEKGERPVAHDISVGELIYNSFDDIIYTRTKDNQIVAILKTSSGSGSGDMLKSVYDTDDDGIVDNSERVNGLTVDTAVPPNAVFTDTVYDDTSLNNKIDANTADISSLHTENAAQQAEIDINTAKRSYPEADENKLAGIEDNANNYVHPTSTGYRHIPTGGNVGQVLVNNGDGSADWEDISGAGGSGIAENLLMNSSFFIHQRGTSSVSSTRTFVADRWYVAASSTTLSRVFIDTANAKYGIEATTTSDRTNVGILIENVGRYMSNKEITITLWSNSSDATIGVATGIKNSTGTEILPTIQLSKTLDTVDGYTRFETTVTEYSTVLGEHYSFLIKIPSGTRMHSPKVEISGSYTGYVPDNEVTELLKCQRYYWKMESGVDHQLFPVTNSASKVRRLQLMYPVEMRTLPTISNHVAELGTGTGTVSSFIPTQETKYGCRISLTSTIEDGQAIWNMVSGEFDAEII